jgi:hypothetical protein
MLPDAGLGDELSLEAARALGWTPCHSLRMVEWCGHGTEGLPSPSGLLPVVEIEAT